MVEESTWAMLTGWDGVRPSTWRLHRRHTKNNFAVHNVHMFMHQFVQPFDHVYAKESCVEPRTIKRESIFINNNISNAKVASRFTKLKHAINATNRSQQSMSKSEQTLRQKTTTEEGARLSRPQTLRKPRVVPAYSRVIHPSATRTDNAMRTPPNSR